MRKTEIEARVIAEGSGPTYRQMDIWTRSGLVTASRKGDLHGQYRDWAEAEVDAMFTVARLVSLGLSVDLAFQLARTQPDQEGVRTLYLDGASKPLITVSVGTDGE